MKNRFLNSTSLTSIASTTKRSESVRSLDIYRYNRQKTNIFIDEENLSVPLETFERGLIISNPMKIDGSSISIESSDLDASELRRALLFWDKLIWPSNNGIYIANGHDANFLINEGRLLRPKFKVNGDAAVALSMTFSETFRILERANPGQWIMSGGEKSLRIHGRVIEGNRGVFAELINAIPIPDRTMPLEDIILFRSKREPEVIALRTAIEQLYQKWVNSEDKQSQFKLALVEIDTAAAEMVRVAKESKYPFNMSSWKVNFNATPDILRATMGYLGASGPLELGTLASLVAGVASSTISFGTGIGLRTPQTASPFQYIASIENRLY